MCICHQSNSLLPPVRRLQGAPLAHLLFWLEGLDSNASRAERVKSVLNSRTDLFKVKIGGRRLAGKGPTYTLTKAARWESDDFTGVFLVNHASTVIVYRLHGTLTCMPLCTTFYSGTSAAARTKSALGHLMANSCYTITDQPRQWWHCTRRKYRPRARHAPCTQAEYCRRYQSGAREYRPCNPWRSTSKYRPRHCTRECRPSRRFRSARAHIYHRHRHIRYHGRPCPRDCPCV